MAQATRQRPGRALLGVLVALIALYAGVFFGPSKTPALGLDLRGGTEVTLHATPIGHQQKVTKSDLDQAVKIINDRVNSLGVGGTDVHTQGGSDIVVSVPGKGRQQVIDTVGETALLRFRQVMAIGSYLPTPSSTSSASATSSPSATPGNGKHGKGSKASSKSGKKAKKGSSQGDVVPFSLPAKVHHHAKAKHTASPSPTTSPSSTSSPSPSPSASPSAEPGSSANNQGNVTKPLPGSESPTLTTAFEKSFANWNCEKHPNPTNGNDFDTDYIIACDPANSPTPVTQRLKYLLAPAALEGTDVSSADAVLDTSGVGWEVALNFTHSGASKWLAITKKTYEVTNSGDSGFQSGCAPPKGCNAIGITLDGVVQSAPATETDGIAGGSAVITGSFSQSEASNLATVLKYGSLPLKFAIPTATSVSATLGSQQLHGGLIAGAIGLALVILFSLLYYRALGFVTVGSLVVSGLILYAVTTLLGHSSVGYTLSLPGIAGFIVAVGITADSFVVYFERLRDEIREGRRLRSAVDRAWPRARRTIISADFVSLLAAVVLYITSIGDVRGFAFTLGLSTISDLFIVFFFTRPLLQVLGRRKSFDSGAAWTGIGSTRQGVTRDTDPEGPTRRRSTRTREA